MGLKVAGMERKSAGFQKNVWMRGVYGLKLGPRGAGMGSDYDPASLSRSLLSWLSHAVTFP